MAVDSSYATDVYKTATRQLWHAYVYHQQATMANTSVNHGINTMVNTENLHEPSTPAAS